MSNIATTEKKGDLGAKRVVDFLALENGKRHVTKVI